MTIETEIAALTSATSALLDSVNVSKDQLEISINDATLVANSAATIASMTVGTYPNSATTVVPTGVLSHTGLVGGSGGTNGTFSASFTGGAGSGAAATFVVSGGAVTSITITNSGLGYTSAPTISFSASSGLTGASATMVVGNIVPNTKYYWASTSDGSYIELYQNNAGAPLKVSPVVSIPSKVQLEKLQSICSPLPSWTALSAITGLASGIRASVSSSDTGTHTDPVIGGTVLNSGVYQYSTSPAGWQRIADLDSFIVTTQRLGGGEMVNTCRWASGPAGGATSLTVNGIIKGFSIASGQSGALSSANPTFDLPALFAARFAGATIQLTAKATVTTNFLVDKPLSSAPLFVRYSDGTADNGSAGNLLYSAQNGTILTRTASITLSANISQIRLIIRTGTAISNISAHSLLVNSVTLQCTAVPENASYTAADVNAAFLLLQTRDDIGPFHARATWLGAGANGATVITEQKGLTIPLGSTGATSSIRGGLPVGSSWQGYLSGAVIEFGLLCQVSSTFTRPLLCNFFDGATSKTVENTEKVLLGDGKILLIGRVAAMTGNETELAVRLSIESSAVATTSVETLEIINSYVRVASGGNALLSADQINDAIKFNRLQDMIANPDIAAGMASAGIVKAIQTVNISSELTAIGWDSVSYPINSPSLESLGGNLSCNNIDVETLWNDTIGDPSAWPAYYVDMVAGLDGNSGLSDGSAFNTISRAIQVVNTAGVPARIFVKGGQGAGQITAGYYNRSKNFLGTGGTTFPTVDIAFYAYGGRAVVAAAESGGNLAWTPDTTYTWVSSGTRSNVLRVFDTTLRDSFGHYVELTKVADLATCSRVPNSWAQVSGTVKVNRADGLIASESNTRIFMTIPNFQQNSSFAASNQRSYLFSGVADGDGFDFEGGSSGCLSFTFNSGTVSNLKMVAAKNCTFRYAGGIGSSTERDNIAIESYHGLVAFQDCDASKSSKDGFNVHNAYGATIGSVSSILTINCTGFDNGRGTSISNNAWTLHENVRGVDICGRYSNIRGSTIHNVGTSKAMILGAYLESSLGDVMNGGSSPPCELRSADDAVIYARLCTCKPSSPPENAIRAEGSSDIYLRDCNLLGSQRIFGTASINTY